jgi:response regulator RpfG family c-di-GMP phosphodiesterase
MTAIANEPARPRLLEIVALQPDDGLRFGWLLADDETLPQRVAAALDGAMRGLGAQAYRLDGLVFGVLGPVALEPRTAAMAAQAAVASVDERLAAEMVYGEARMPDEAVGDAAMRLALDRLQARVRRHRLSPGRQVRDVLLSLLQERRAGGTPVSLPRVASYAVSVGRRLGLSLAALDDVVRAAELQDVGKLVLPEAILAKRGPLDDEEWEIVRTHPVIAERIVASAPALASVARLVRSCAERWDGGGQPDGLSGEAIPLGSRIVAVTVAYDAMTSARPYRPARSTSEALDELCRCAGRQFDPTVVSAFCAIVDDRNDTTVELSQLGHPA